MGVIVYFLVSLPLAFATLVGFNAEPNTPVFESVEVGVAELSPAGEAGGYAIPASGTSQLCAIGECPEALAVTRAPSSPGGINEGQQYRFTGGRIKNLTRGEVISNLQSDYQIDLDRNGSIDVTRSSAVISLDGQEEKTVTASASWRAEYGQTGRHRVRLLADPNERTSDPDRSDNMSDWVNFEVIEAPEPEKPNLGVNLAPQKPGKVVVGDSITFTGARVKNRTADVDVTTRFQNQYEIDSNGDGVADFTRATGRMTLAGGAQQVVTAPNPWTVSAPGTYNVRLVTDVENDVDESIETDNASRWTEFTVEGEEVPQANLVAVGLPNLGTFKVGDTVTFSSSASETYAHVTNSGKADTENKFNNQYEIDLDRDGDIDIYLTTGNILLAEGEIAYPRARIWIPTADDVGEHRIRFVADFNGTVDEPNESDNISNWAYFKVSNDEAPFTVFEAQKVGTDTWSDNITIEQGDNIILRWESYNTNYCVSENYFSIGSRGRTIGTKSNAPLPPSGNSYTYRLRCYNEATGEQDPDAVTVTRTGSSLDEVNVSIDANPKQVRQRGTTLISWDTDGASNCEINGSNGQAIVVTGQTGFEESIPLEGETIYTIICTEGSASTEASVLINVLPFFEEI